MQRHPEVVAAYLGEEAPEAEAEAERLESGREEAGPMSYLEVRSLRVGYGSIPVLQGIDFDVQAGQTTVLLGLNGAGKTTTVASIAGLLKPTGGHDHLRRRAHRRPRPRRARPARHRPRSRRVDGCSRRSRWRRTCASARGPRARAAELKTAEERVYDYFPILAERRDQLAGTLSGGQQQMLAIGRGLMSLPKLMLIDEASLGLSPKLAKTVFEIVDRINDDGVTVIIVEQNVGVLRHADSALVMEKGAIVYSGSGDELRHGDELRKTYLGAAS